MITFFFNDHRIGGPHKQIYRYTLLIKKKERKKFKYITPDFYYKKFLLEFRKYLFFFEIFFITIFIIFNKKSIFYFPINYFSPSPELFFLFVIIIILLNSFIL